MSTSALTCASGQHEQCVNTRGQIWTDANGHGDFYPECVSTANNNTTKPITDPPKIPATARCTESRLLRRRRRPVLREQPRARQR